MSKKKRDDFTPNDKRIMAERVSWKCSFPGCGRNTVGPNSDDPTKKVNNGIAAHIHAAASGGPRYNPQMTPEQRKHISNGIWMCRDHGNLIDADYTEYSATTLHEWKKQAEKRAKDSLKSPTHDYIIDNVTLIQLGAGIVYYAIWSAVHAQEWSFELVSPLIGDFDTLNSYILEFGTIPENEAYIVVESQGDARKVLDARIELSPQDKPLLIVQVDRKFQATDPNALGMDLKLDETGDLDISKGGIGMVSGLDTAKQNISTCMSTIKGEIVGHKELGSLATHYFENYIHDLDIFSKLIHLELVRLSLIPVESTSRKEKVPSLYFVKRILKVEVKSAELSYSRFKASVELEWGNGELWSGEVPIFVLQT